MNIRILLFIAISLTPFVVNAQTPAFERGEALVAQENYQAAIAEYSKVSPRAGDLYARAVEIAAMDHQTHRIQGASRPPAWRIHFENLWSLSGDSKTETQI